MDHRVIRLILTGALALAGLFAMHRGTSLRAAAEPVGSVAIGAVDPGRGPGVLGAAGEVELRSPERVQVLGPAVSRVGQGVFHLGVGLATAAVVMAVLTVIGAAGQHWTNAIRLLVLVPAAWALWKMASEGGPQAMTATAASENFAAYSPVLVVSSLLGLGFGARRNAGDERGPTPRRT